MASASLFLPCSQRAMPRLLTQVSVEGCSGPSSFSMTLKARRCMVSPSLYLPWL
ncbi:uncharacterized protein ASPGLDRAFT_486713 [Aspergillus glaucus CBS 516.65]|uniref:Uncharacterized protein n=1 Tax=Aspergillus glaucus CBS 516.65 TaxID=1160497 RepID=A0A1L9VFI0_ASPGL|nr:hypothetical protein ASPGLDRAFT_486713 [Aspergillus glaucus CBS 516.65]OJJ82687.1 hypothetical protein ASPGLDRAFT_486713 [Aspergillus glaucus CBS 516.65]